MKIKLPLISVVTLILILVNYHFKFSHYLELGDLYSDFFQLGDTDFLIERFGSLWKGVPIAFIICLILLGLILIGEVINLIAIPFLILYNTLIIIFLLVIIIGIGYAIYGFFKKFFLSDKK